MIDIKERTLAILKPDSVKKKLSGKIIFEIEKNNFAIIGLRTFNFTEEKASEFYKVHALTPFFAELVEFMTSGPVILMVLEKEKAVSEFRKLIGATDPKKAEKSTIRSEFGDSIGSNAIHGSDDLLSAKNEISFFFKSEDLL